MSETSNSESRPAILPSLEQLLVRAARRQAAPRFGRRRWVLAATAATLVLAAGAAAATGVFHIADGETSRGAFSVESKPVPASLPGEPARGSICMQLRYGDRGPSYGCGDPPSASRPFGLVVADSLEAGPREPDERVIYGLVSSEIARVRVLEGAGRHTDTLTEVKEGLPGRFFAVAVPYIERIALVGYDVSGRQRGSIGTLAEPSHPPRSHAEAVAQGDPAGFAPTASASE